MSFFYHGATSPVGQGLLIVEDSWSHSDAPHSVGLLWTSDQPDAETYTLQHITITRNRHLCPGGIRTNNSSKRAAADPRLRLQLIRNWNYIRKRIIWKLLRTTEFQ